MIIEPITTSVVAPLPLARAFERFARELHAWWPRAYTWSQDVLHDIGIEPWVGGLCFEIGPGAFRCDWGRVLDWAPPEHLSLAWQISPRREPVPDPARSSTVTVTFAIDGLERTLVTLLHEHFERHGPDGAEYRAAMASAQGWPWILRRFVDSAA